jgi:hypothetical protein
MKIHVLALEVAVCRLDPAAEAPPWGRDSRLYSVTRTARELSVVCECRFVPDEVRAERCWSVLELEGPIPFEQTGVLASILEPLAAARVGIFAISTYDTDYVLVRTERLEDAVRALAGRAEIAR